MPEEDRFVIPDLQRIGKYDVLERIADGGFATIYRGRDPFLKRLVAIKVCVSDDPELRQQFLREAEIAGNLDHPSIVRTFDFGFDQVGPYLVQEFLQGEDLSRLIERRAPLSPRRKLELLIQIAEGLAYSHAQQVLHLDVKPANIRVVGMRQAKLVDFGIARLATGAGTAQIVGGMIGTAGYLPPEQVMGRAVDTRSDVFAFGALAYELFTHCRPFTGGTMGELLKRVLETEAAPMTQHWPDCSEALANVIGRCLRRDPAARYPGFDALLPELAALKDVLPDSVAPAAESTGAPAAESAGASSAAGAASGPAPGEPDPVAAAATAAHEPRPVRGMPPPKAAAAASPSRRRSLIAAAAVMAAAAVGAAIFLALPGAGDGTVTRSSGGAAPASSPGLAAAPGPGVLLVSAVPWGEVTRITSAEGALAELPGERVTPLRLWLSPGRHEAEIVLAGGEIARCSVDVVEGATHLCHVVSPAPPGGTLDYWKEMGWWQ